MERAKSIRSNRKGLLTKAYNKIARKQAEKDFAQVQDTLVQMSKHFDELEDAHYSYIDHMTDNSDKFSDSDINSAEAWFKEVNSNYLVNVNKAQAWLADNGVATSLSQSTPPAASSAAAKSIETVSCDLAAILSIPKLDIPVFQGDPREYHSFISVFDRVIGDVITDDRVKIAHLRQYVSGAAEKTILPYIVLGTRDAYCKAREALEKRYGNSHILCQKVIDDLRYGKPATRPSDLRQLADDLASAQYSLSNVGMLSEVQNQYFIRDVLARCHGQVRSRWRSLALDQYHSKGTYPEFAQLVSFMDRMADEACNPIYGYESFKTGNRVTNVMTEPVVDSSSPPYEAPRAQSSKCLLCSGSHVLTKCHKFQAMSPKQRSNFAISNRLCFSCLLPSHRLQNCISKRVCSIDGCESQHHTWLHFPRTNFSRESRENSQGRGLRVDRNKCENDKAFIATSCTNDTAICLPLVPVLVNNEKVVLALLDSASTSTLISDRLARELDLQGPEVPFRVQTLGHDVNMKTNRVSFKLTSTHDDAVTYDISGAYVVSDIPSTVPHGVTLSRYPHLLDLPLPELCAGARPDILIGQDHPGLLVPLEVRCDVSQDRSPYATKTLMGWVLQGPTVSDSGNINYAVCSNINITRINDEITKLWDIEHECETERSWSVEDHKVYDLWERETVYENERYTVPVPWRPGAPNFPNNYKVALKRLDSTVRKLRKSNSYEVYDENLHKLVQDGHAELVPTECLERDDGAVWYIPHHAVVSDKKPGKIRIVFDCSAKHCEMSLNNQCYQGPNICNKLQDVLVRFRQHAYAITADIKAMYLQVRLPVDSRDCFRFLWYEGNEVVQYRMTSHLFGGVFCASSTTYALRRTLQDFQASSLVSEAVCKSMYVDDLLRSYAELPQAMQACTAIQSLLLKGGFELTKFVSNSTEIFHHLPESDLAHSDKDISDILCSALGMKWEVEDDCFSYRRKPCQQSQAVTKRIMLSHVSSLYDPLGLVMPIIILGRMLFQQATRLKLQWDDEIPGSLLSQWSAWWYSLDSLPSLKFPRHVVPHDFTDGVMELHTFCDGSESAYAACTYLRIVNQKGKVHTQLLAAKSRLTPLKAMTTPRVELCAAVLAVKLDEMLRAALEIDLLPSVFWSDSMIVLSYIRSESHRFKVFVANRVSYITALTTPQQWHHVSSTDNPADVASRGCLAASLPLVWMSGPPFLGHLRDAWSPEVDVPLVCDLDPETKPAICCLNSKSVFVHPLDALIEHYSDYYRLKKALAWLLCIKRRLLHPGTSVQLKASHMKEAEEMLVKHVQKSSYAQELEDLQQGRPVPRSSPILRLNPKISNGLLIVSGRLCHSPHVVCPWILPANDKLSRLILLEYHGMAHLGTEWVLSRLQTKFWIVGARNKLRHIRRSCVTCQKLFGRPKLQVMADLPPERCTVVERPFTHVGLDLFGPFLVAQGRSTVKRYGCIFTCLSVRAIHLEVLPSLHTDAFINGLRRFCARRGQPVTIRSDRGTNLVGAQSELLKEVKRLDKSKIHNAMRRMDIEWSFNPPMSSHQGGVWERMIRTVRKVLLAIMPKEALTDDILSTLFCEVENIINSRPLTKCSMDVHDLAPLCPNHFLLLEGNVAPSWRQFHDGESCRKRWMRVQMLVASFWKRWIREYLPLLQGRQKWNQISPDYQVGDLVFVHDEVCSPGQWPLGLITSINVGRDGHVRSVGLKVRNTQLVRPITKLVPLELS